MVTSFAFYPDGSNPTLHYTKTNEKGDVMCENVYSFKYMYGFVEGQEYGGQILVPHEYDALPSEVIVYLREQENLYGFQFAPESRVEGESVLH